MMRKPGKRGEASHGRAGTVLKGKKWELAGLSFRLYLRRACRLGKTSPGLGNRTRRDQVPREKEVKDAANTASSAVCNYAGRCQRMHRPIATQKETDG